MTKNTPTPWKITNTTGFMTAIYTEDGSKWVGTLALQGLHWSEAEANAKHIVKCVNEHEALKAEVKRCRDIIEELNLLEIGMTVAFNSYKRGDGLLSKEEFEEKYHDRGREHQMICDEFLKESD